MSVTFADLGVPADIADRLARRGITEAFPIQAATLADTLAGRDLCGRAPTGSGKTLAFGIPLIARVGKARARRPRGLVLVPTRELAAQVRKELTLLSSGRGRSVTAIYGGVGFGPQIEALRSGTDVIVACPGRLADLVAKGEARLDEVDLVVIDEADRMADMGFLPEVRRLLDQVSPQRQTLLFSATLDGDVDVLVRRYQHDPVRHELVAGTGEVLSRHVFWRVERPERLGLTAQVIGAEWPALIFCRTKRGADRLAGQLAKQGVSAAALHGDRSQSQRERALAAFAAGRVQALVATDIAARGIHVDGVACVVHFDPAGDEKDYVHRSGRTGRAGASGTIVSLVGREQLGDVAKLQARLGLPRRVDVADLGELADDRHLASVSAGPHPTTATRKVFEWGAGTRQARPPRSRPAAGRGGRAGGGGSRGTAPKSAQRRGAPPARSVKGTRRAS
ncbi:DEAD/DEAH box helicase [soil metagenome]